MGGRRSCGGCDSFILGYEKVLWINDWIVEHRRRTDDTGLEGHVVSRKHCDLEGEWPTANAQ